MNFDRLFDRSYIYTLPAILTLAATTIFPFVYIIYLSLHEYDLRYIATRGSTFLGAENFVSVLTSPSFWSSFQTTVVYIGSALLIEIILGILIAVFVNSLPPFFAWMKSIVLTPMMLTPVGIATTFRLLYNYEHGLIGYLMELMGLNKVAWLAGTNFARLAIVIADVWQWTPLLALISIGALQAVPKAPLEAAEIDGAGLWQKFRYIILPHIKPILGVGILIRFMDIAKFFDKIYVLTGGGPGTATETLTYHIYKVGFKFLKMGYGAALSLFVLFGMIVISLLIVKITKAGEQIT